MTFDALVTLLKFQLEKSTYWADEPANKTDILVTLLVFQLAIALASTNDPSLAKAALRLVTLPVFQFSKPVKLVMPVAFWNKRDILVTLETSQSLIPVKDDRLEAPSKVLCIEVTLLVSKLLASKLVKVVFFWKVLSKLVLASLIFLSSVLLKAIVAAFCQLLIKSLEIDTWRPFVDLLSTAKSASLGTIIWVWSPV